MITSRTRLVAPSPVVTLARMQEHLRLDLIGSPPSHPEDDLVEFYTAAVTNGLDAGADGLGWLGRAIGPQTWRVGWSCFPTNTRWSAFKLPFPPLLEVTEVAYTDVDGANQVIAPGDYRLASLSGFAVLMPALNESWPATANVPDAVRVTYRCGYDETLSPIPNPVPDDFKHYIMVRAASAYLHREDMTLNTNVQPIGNWANMLETHRVYL